MGPMAAMPPPNSFLETLLGKEVYVKLAKDWSVQGRLNRIDEAGLVLERVGIPPILVRFEQIGTIEEAQ
jgi:hypothetical protein